MRLRITHWRVSIATACFLAFTSLASNIVVTAPAEALDAIPIELDWDFYKKVWLSDLPVALPSEPKLGKYDAQKAAQFLDHYGAEWSQQNHCGTCHTNLAALLARPDIREIPATGATAMIRAELLMWADDRRAKPDDATVPILIPTATALAINDIKSGRPVDGRVAELWNYIWDHQSPDGSWTYKVEPFLLPFLERDRYYTAMLAALSAGYMSRYQSTEPEQHRRLARLKAYLLANPPTSLHHQAVLLWVSAHLDGVLSVGQKSAIQHHLLKLQNIDGGWTLAALGTWPRHDGAPNDPHGPSDGYATALASLALCEGANGAGTPAIRSSMAWLNTNQRKSGRWYTRSLVSDRFHNYLSTMATGYAVMAIASCELSDARSALNLGEASVDGGSRP